MAQVTGGDKLEQALAQIRDRVLKATAVRVGFLDSTQEPGSELNVPTVAAINNFGAPEAGIPARPFFSNMVAENSPDWGAKFAEVLVATDYDTKAALEFMGRGIADQLRVSLDATESPPNSPVTLLLKDRFPSEQGRTDMTFSDVLQARADVKAGKVPGGEHSKPLLWTGVMRSNIDSEVE
ncbi:hypothetical protein [Novosphingobium colocasiae]|uniref:hypothetical protein n=1 Tax=Novosphingobium colocasiae TaxID=1256513 RepID=UPI0035AF97A9